MQSINVDIERKEILNRYRGLLRDCSDKTTKEDKKKIRKAFNIAVEAHKDMRRKSGEPYIYHPIDVARIAAKEIGLSTTSIICSLLHDVVEDTDYTLEDIERLFDSKVARIIDGLTKISEVYDQNVSMQAENFRKMLLTLSDDIRVILIKLADRLHNMRTLSSMPKHKQLKIASETLYLYAPLAHRLGLYAIKTELEDLGLKYTKSEIYKAISEKLAQSKAARVRYINKFVQPIKEELNNQSFNYSIKGRPKSIFSIRSKMIKQGVEFEEVFDKFAIRIIVKSNKENEKSDCWRIYSIVTDFYRPNPDRLRDWISTPKANGYESLHTTVMGPNGKWVEVQIRTERMDDIAEKGFAAHWKYKNSSKESNLDNWINRIRELLESPNANAIDFVDDFKMNLFSEEIFIFTPNGDLKTLPKDATPIDFAYEIHTEVGSRCLGAKVNGKLVPFSHSLKSGDQVEIITSNKQSPKEDWLSFVKTSRAKSKIKNALKEEKKKIASEGKEILKRKLRHIKVTLDHNTENEMLKYFNLKNSLDMYYMFGVGALNNKHIRSYVNTKNQGWYGLLKRRIYSKDASKSEEKIKIPKNKPTVIFGDDQQVLDYKLAKCCSSIQGDEIFGFTTINDGLKVHNVNCPNAIQLQSRYAYRIIPAKWATVENLEYSSVLKISGYDQIGLVSKITKLISNEMNVNISSINIKSNDGVFDGRISVLVINKVHLENLINKLENIEGVESVVRL
ncbi:MAG: bifunctional (p)ppGpp synthetase/guanosine-3',5'-bis(diphosphate) 3'-pyrophosphohydrolase [Flavobacteriales bacterium]|nr:bifunctional (p)ppGpp synthetase/guanosine-3',5'-bis(diphosphate) 3'-pyrophosphohydrolase [Flavobacteriales bacterium]